MWRRDNYKLVLLRSTSPRRERDILQIAAGTGDAWSTTIEGKGPTLLVFNGNVTVYRGPPVLARDQLFATKVFVGGRG